MYGSISSGQMDSPRRTSCIRVFRSNAGSLTTVVHIMPSGKGLLHGLIVAQGLGQNRLTDAAHPSYGGECDGGSASRSQQYGTQARQGLRALHIVRWQWRDGGNRAGGLRDKARFCFQREREDSLSSG